MNGHKVYLIHGMWGFSLEFLKIRKALAKQNMQGITFSYNSVTTGLQISAEKLYKKVKASGEKQVSFITHSMGALLLRSMLQIADGDKEFPTIFRIVMIAPPNQGAASANHLYSNYFTRIIFGVNLKHICNHSHSLSRRLPMPTDIETGIIAGNFNGVDDGEIRIEETKLGIEKDFAMVKSHHIFILQNKLTVFMTVNFFLYSKF